MLRLLIVKAMTIIGQARRAMVRWAGLQEAGVYVETPKI